MQNLLVSTYPPKVALSGNPVEWKIKTSNENRYYTPPVYSYVYFNIGSGLDPDDTVVLEFSDTSGNDYTKTFTYKALTPDADNNEFTTMDELVDLLVNEYHISKFYTITRGSEYDTVQLKALTLDAAFDITLSGDAVGMNGKSDAQAGIEREFYKINCRYSAKIGEGLGFSVIGTEQAAPDSRNYALFNIAEYLHRMPEQEFTYPGTDDLIQEKTLVLAYRVEFWDSYYDTDGNYQEGTVMHSSIFYAVFGKVSDILMKTYEEHGSDFFTQVEIGKQFLTWQPLTKYVFQDQPERLFFFVYSEFSAINNLSLKAKFHYSDNTFDDNVTLETFDDPKMYTILECHVGFSDISGAANGAKTVEKYEVWLEDVSGNPYSEVRTFIIRTDTQARKKTFVFLNNAGGYDTAVFTGLFAKDAEFDRQLTKNTDSQYREGEVLTEDLYTGNSGWLKPNSRAHKEYFLEFFNSREIYEITEEYMYRVVLTSKELPMFKDRDNLFSFAFSYRRSVADSLYIMEGYEVDEQGLLYTDEDLVAMDDDGSGISLDKVAPADDGGETQTN